MTTNQQMDDFTSALPGQMHPAFSQMQTAYNNSGQGNPFMNMMFGLLGRVPWQPATAQQMQHMQSMAQKGGPLQQMRSQLGGGFAPSMMSMFAGMNPFAQPAPQPAPQPQARAPWGSQPPQHGVWGQRPPPQAPQPQPQQQSQGAFGYGESAWKANPAAQTINRPGGFGIGAPRGGTKSWS